MEMVRSMKEVIQKYGSFNPIPLETLEPHAARQLPELKDAVLGVIQDHATKRLINGFVEPIEKIEHATISTEKGDLLARIYRPSEDKPLPVLLYFHGGGWVIGGINSYDASCRALANAAECIVVSVGYRQAPEHRYPAAHEDAFAAYQWLLHHVGTLGGDPKRIAIGGESAGGNLAASVCLKAKYEGLRMPVHQLLICPVLDSDLETPSYLEQADAKPLNREMMKWFMHHYFGGIVQDASAFPLQAADLSDLPSATVITAELDPLCSEGEMYAQRLQQSGVAVFARRYEGVAHEFFSMVGVVDEAKDALNEAVENMTMAFRSVDDDYDDRSLRITEERPLL